MTSIPRYERCGWGRWPLITVASYRRRQLLAEEVPGLNIRRLTLEDPKGAKDRSQSSSARHVCYPRRRPSPPLIGPGRKTSSYRSVTRWFNQMKDDAPAFLTITSLQLPDSPIPLIDSQAIARSCRSRESTCNSNDDKDAIMDELLRKVVAVRGQSEGQKSKRNKDPSFKCNREFTDLEECTRRIIEGPASYVRKRTTRSSKAAAAIETGSDNCICSEVSENLRINIRKKTEVRRSSRSPSPEITHIIRIAMKYHGQEDGMSEEELKSQKPPEDETIIDKGDADRPDLNQKQRCPGVSVALDFTLNCSSLQLTSRDVCVKTLNKGKDQSEAEDQTGF